MERSLARVLILSGLVIAAFGVVILLGGRIPWIGRLPGDLRIHRDGVAIYLPIVTCILFSIILTILLNLLSRR